jgi:membrane protein implicated in regulation of membrane protease activity
MDIIKILLLVLSLIAAVALVLLRREYERLTRENERLHKQLREANLRAEVG